MNTNLTPELRIKRQIIKDIKNPEGKPLDDASQVEYAWDFYRDGIAHGDYLVEARDEFRYSGEKTGIPGRECSRHYESDEVARKLDDGTWVAWTYWHGGGKYGEPSSIDWMEYAYEINVTEEEKMVVVRTFTKA